MAGTRHGLAAHGADNNRDLVEAHAALDAEEGRWLLCALRLAAHVHLGFGSFSQYIERLFGYKPRTTQEKRRVAEALEMLPPPGGRAPGWFVELVRPRAS